ncbi:MAG: PTS cellobiose transporter subunit IIB [Lactobacillaceae bacterium]|jgi:PTS system cellobiose-specific IIB component|nr:PTS cellobiose transporter subunit IIB [Lactobacillaceae bacterium]
MAEILLVDAAGMSITMLSNKMDQYSKENNLGYTVVGLADAQAGENITKKQPVVIMIAPQVKYMHEKYEEAYGDKIPVVDIEMMSYGMMSADKVMQQAIDALK